MLAFISRLQSNRSVSSLSIKATIVSWTNDTTKGEPHLKAPKELADSFVFIVLVYQRLVPMSTVRGRFPVPFNCHRYRSIWIPQMLRYI